MQVDSSTTAALSPLSSALPDPRRKRSQDDLPGKLAEKLELVSVLQLWIGVESATPL